MSAGVHATTAACSAHDPADGRCRSAADIGAQAGRLVDLSHARSTAPPTSTDSNGPVAGVVWMGRPE
jgi:hypothetical protein